jgi:hypothetical protein
MSHWKLARSLVIRTESLRELVVDTNLTWLLAFLYNDNKRRESSDSFVQPAKEMDAEPKMFQPKDNTCYCFIPVQNHQSGKVGCNLYELW